ncbi:hypothetical protein TWF718_005102 [Orbilia javanica]|uniref:Uncharacterized protein n=1 Tax=Orbilia javanica TaxID=47235 RepID=A0AAN8RFH9_9PEZI
MRFSFGSRGPWLPLGIVILGLTNVQALFPMQIPHEIFQQFIEPGLREPPHANTNQEVGIGNDLLQLQKASWKLKDLVKLTPLRNGPMVSGLQAFGAESIFEIIDKIKVIVDKLLTVLTNFESEATEADDDGDPDLDVKHSDALAAIQKVKALVPSIPKFEIDTPVDFWKLTPIPPGSRDLNVWKALENLIVPFNVDIEDPVARTMIWLGYDFEPNSSGTSGTWYLNPDKADLRGRILESIAKAIEKAARGWDEPWGVFNDATINTPMESAIPEQLKDQMVEVIGQSFLDTTQLYHDNVRKLMQSLDTLNMHVMALVEDLPEGWDRED